MNIFSSEKFESYDDLLVEQIKDLYDAEQRMLDFLPKIEEKATASKLKDVLHEHMVETQKQINRLESAFDELGVERERKSCDAMAGLVKETEHVLDAEGDSDVINSALIVMLQRIQHYEIAGYGGVRCIAARCGYEGVAKLMQETLDEEKGVDAVFAELAETCCNPTEKTCKSGACAV